MTGSGIFDRKALQALLEKEFGLCTDDFSEADYARARQALSVYESVEEFLKATGWERDNPELCGEAYLTENRICRWAGGKLVYFSWLIWEPGSERGPGQ